MAKYLLVIGVILGLAFSLGTVAGKDIRQLPPRPSLPDVVEEVAIASVGSESERLPEVLRYPNVGREEAPLESSTFGRSDGEQIASVPQQIQIDGSMVWKVETVDHPGNVGEYPSLAFDDDGYLNIGYYDGGNGNLKYGYRDLDGSGWHTYTADDAAENVGQYVSLATDSKEWPHMVYYGVDEKVLWYIYWDGSGWQRERVDGEDAGQYASLALDSNDHAHISYYDETNHNLKYGYRRGANDWQVETVHGSSEWVGWYSSLALDSSERPHIAYYDASNKDLLYASFDGSYWMIESVDYTGDVGVECSLAIDGYDVPHISYWEWGDKKNLKYAFRNSGTWYWETVDSKGNVGRYSSISADSSGYPHISYYDWDKTDLKYATWTGSEWHIETVASHGNVGVDSSITLDRNGNPAISYYKWNTGDLKVAIGRASTDLDQVPQELFRRANQHLEDRRHSSVAPEWVEAKLGSDVRALYRPDVEGIAYYEFPVLTSEDEPAGFIQLAADEHDYSVPHWSPTGLPPTHLLDQQAQADYETVAKYFKLDALSYAGQNSAGELVASTNNLPAKISGFDAAWLDESGHEQSSTWALDTPIADDSNSYGTSGTLKVNGDDPPSEMKVESWGSWAELKSGYVESYGAHLDELTKDAGEDWETERTINQNGRVLYNGDVYDMTLLYAHGTAYFEGEGKNYIQYQSINRDELSPLLRITVVSAPSEAQPLVVRVKYDNGVEEIVNFYIAPGARQAGNRVYLPVILGSGTKTMASRASDFGPVNLTRTTQSPWEPQWLYATPDRVNFGQALTAQRWYRQMNSGEWPNVSECASGCGATAWAILFGWADNRAADGDPSWAHRWGIYRQGGYSNSSGTVAAPPHMYSGDPETEGVKRMTLEIRGYVDTFCILGKGATAPWTMGKAAQYLQGRTGAGLTSKGSVVGRKKDSYRDEAIYTIYGRGAPAIVSSGWFINGHYPVAFGYSWNVRDECHWYSGCSMVNEYNFLVNLGWGRVEGDESNVKKRGWDVIPAKTWFVGTIWPQ